MTDKTVKLIISAKDEASQALKDVASNAAALERAAADSSQRLATIAAGFVGLIASSAAVGVKVFEVAAKFESLNAQLKTATGSAAGAGLAFDSLTQFATETPYELDQVVSAFIKLKNLGLDPSTEALRSYGNTASAMGKSLDQMVEAVADAATGEFERLKEFGIKAKSQGDQVSFTFQGITTTIGKNSAEIEGYLRQIGDVNFATAMSDKMETLDGKISNLKDSIDLFYKKLGDAGGLSASKFAVDALISSVQLLSDNIDDVLVVLALASAGVIAANFGIISTAIYAAATAATAATGVMAVLGQTLAIAGAAFVGYQIGTFFYEMTDGAKEAKQAIEDLKGAQDNLKEVSGQVTGRLKELSDQTGVNIRSLDDFNQKTKDGTLVWDEQTSSWVKGTKALNDLNGSAMQPLDEKIKALTPTMKAMGMVWDETAQAFVQAKDKIKDNSQAVADAKKQQEEAARSAETLKLKLLELASNETIKSMEFAASINIAGIEADTKRIEAAFTSINTSISSSGETLSSFWNLLGSGNISGLDKLDLKSQIDAEEKRRQSAFDQQKELTAQQIEMNELRLESLRNGGSMITINGEGLAPELEAFLFKILQNIQTRVSGDYGAYLLGI